MRIFYKKYHIAAVAISLAVIAVVLFTLPIDFDFGSHFGIAISQAHAEAPQAQPDPNASDFLGMTPVGQAGIIIEAILYFIQAVLYLLISIAGLLFGIAVQFNLDLLQPANNVAVSVGWDIFRVITNLGFVLGIIVIAIGTIIRSRSYRAQQILWRLIVAALLVNFSLVIAGGILQVSDSLTGYFLKSLTGTQQYDFGGVSVTANDSNNQIMGTLVAEVTGFFQLPNVVTPQGESAGWFKKALLKVANVLRHVALGPTILELFSLVLTVVVFLIIFLTLLVLSGQVFVRYFFITMLLIVSPIVWLMWIFPFGQRWWREWWNHFIKWAFMLPLNLFFLYLAIAQLKGVIYGIMTKKVTGLMETMQYVMGGNVDFSAIMGSMMAVGFIVLGMKLSHKLGIAAADGGIKMAQSAGSFVKEKGVEYGKRGAAKAFVRTGAAEGVQKGLTAVGETAIGRRLGFGKMAQRFAVGRIGVEKKAGAFIEERTRQLEEIYKARGVKGVEALLGTGTPQERAIMLALLASKEKLGPDSEARKKFGEDQLLASAEALERDGQKNKADAIYTSLGYKRAGLDARDEYSRNGTSSALESAYTELELVRMKKDTGTATGAEVRTAEEKYADALTADQVAQQKVKSIRNQFDKDYSKTDEQLRITKALYSKKEEDLTAGEKIDRLGHADDIVSDPSGRKFYGVLPALDSDQKIVGLLRNLVKAATKQTELSGSLDKSLQGALGGVKGGINDLKIEMRKAGADDKVTIRVANQIRKSVAGDLGSGEFGAKAEAGTKLEEPKELKEKKG